MRNVIFNVFTNNYTPKDILEGNNATNLTKVVFKSLRLSNSEIFLPACVLFNYYTKVPILLNNNYEAYCIRNILQSECIYTSLSYIKKYLCQKYIKYITIQDTKYLIGAGNILLEDTLQPVFMIGMICKLIEDTITYTPSIYINNNFKDNSLIKSLKRSIDKVIDIDFIDIITNYGTLALTNLDNNIRILQSDNYDKLFNSSILQKPYSTSYITFNTDNVLRSLGKLEL